MGYRALTVGELYGIANEYFGEDLLHIEVLNIGVRFVCADRKHSNKDYSSFFQCALSEVTSPAVRGFLDAETRGENISR